MAGLQPKLIQEHGLPQKCIFTPSTAPRVWSASDLWRTIVWVDLTSNGELAVSEFWDVEGLVVGMVISFR